MYAWAWTLWKIIFLISVFVLFFFSITNWLSWYLLLLFFVLKNRSKILITRMVFAVKMCVCTLAYRCVWVSASLCPTLVKETTIFMWGSVIICHVCVLRGERKRSILAGSIQGYYMESASLYPPSRCTGPHLYLAAQPAAVPLVFYPTLAQYTAYRCAMNKHTSKQVAKQKNPDSITHTNTHILLSFAFKWDRKWRDRLGEMKGVSLWTIQQHNYL